MVAFLKAALGVLATDRTVHIGGTVSALAIIAGASPQSIDLWLGIVTKGVGLLAAIATLIYTCLKIRRQLRDPSE
jgi:hypothetical protein